MIMPVFYDPEATHMTLAMLALPNPLPKLVPKFLPSRISRERTARKIRHRTARKVRMIPQRYAHDRPWPDDEPAWYGIRV